MAEYEKKVRKIMLQNGCTFVRRGKGDHDIWYSPITNRNITVDTKIKSIKRRIVLLCEEKDLELKVRKISYLLSECRWHLEKKAGINGFYTSK